MVVGENGVLNRAQDAKQKTDLAKEKENIQFSIASGYSPESLYREISLSYLQESLDSHFGKNEATAKENPDGTFTVKVKATGNEYQLTKTGQEINVNKVKDEQPAVLSGTGSEEDPFLIESIEDLIFFSYKVRSGTTYEGQYVELATDLNFASSDSYVDPNCEDYSEYGYTGKIKEEIDKNGFIPIGSFYNDEATEKTFYGVFDGNSKKMSNLKINTNIQNEDTFCTAGLFSADNGTIKNLKVNMEADLSYNVKKFSGGGIIAGATGPTGIIENCEVSGKIGIHISGYAFNLGGITGSNRGIIKNCCNMSDLTIDGNLTADGSRIGGVCGINEFDGIMKNCYNSGTLSVNLETGGANIGGCLGLDNTSNRQISYFYNVGNVIDRCNAVTSLDACLGASKTGTIEQLYSLNNLVTSSNTLSQIQNNFSVKSTSELSGQAGVTLLNKDNDEQVWVEDTNNINSGYPILNWQVENN